MHHYLQKCVLWLKSGEILECLWKCQLCKQVFQSHSTPSCFIMMVSLGTCQDHFCPCFIILVQGLNERVNDCTFEILMIWQWTMLSCPSLLGMWGLYQYGRPLTHQVNPMGCMSNQLMIVFVHVFINIRTLSDICMKTGHVECTQSQIDRVWHARVKMLEGTGLSLLSNQYLAT